MKIYIVIILCLFALQVNAQWLSTSYISKEKIHFQLVNNSEEYFCFPGLEDCKSLVVDKQLKLSDNGLIKFASEFGFSKDIKVGYHYSFDNPVEVKSLNGRLTLNSYVNNIKRCLLLIRDVNLKWLAKEIYFEGEGYNTELNFYLNSFSGQVNGNDQQMNLNLVEIYLLCEASIPDLNSKLVIGNLSISEYESHIPGSNHPWINGLLSGERISNVNMLDEYSQWAEDKLSENLTYSEIPTFDEFGDTHGYLAELINFDCVGNDCDERKFFESFVKEYLKIYPFYTERGLDSAGIKNRISNFFSENTLVDYSDFIHSFKDLFSKELADPHVGIEVPSTMIKNDSNWLKGPIRLKTIGGNTMVAAVFNQSLNARLPIGSVVTAIDGQSIIEENEIDKLITKTKYDSLSLDFYDLIDKEKISNIKIPYTLPASIPRTFIPKHGDFEMDKDSIAYLYFSRWEGDASILLLNTKDKILRSKGLIIDLRGNGGGYSSDVLQTLSLFLHQPMIIGKMNHHWLNESIIVYPANNQLRFPTSLKVSILVDNYTACSSEVFLIGMKSRPNTVVIGESKTKGAIASPALFRFPSGLIFKGHTKFRQYIFNQHVFNEARGIEPDVLVSRTHPRDLYPYNDKIRKIAIRILSTF